MTRAADELPADIRWLCGELARQARDLYPDMHWRGVAPVLQRIWGCEPRGVDWRVAAPVIEAAWWATPSPIPHPSPAVSTCRIAADEPIEPS